MGHALVAAALKGDKVHKVSIIPRGIGALGYTIQRPTDDRYLMRKEELEATGKEIVSAVREADMVGLDPHDYHAERLETLLLEGDLAALDPLLADAMLTMAIHRGGGRVDQRSLGPRRLSEGDIDALLAWAVGALASGHPADANSALDRELDMPLLIEALGEHRALAALGGWSVLSLEEWLVLGGDLQPGEEMEVGIARFQERQGLSPTGVLDAATEGELAVPIERRIEQLAINALGRINFVLPNRYGVQLHDTPSKELFLREDRCASSGCIRVGRPIELAIALLGETWTSERLLAAIESGVTEKIELPDPMPTHLVYFTSWIDGAGALQVRRDVYGRDRALGRALADRKRTRISLPSPPRG